VIIISDDPSPDDPAMVKEITTFVARPKNDAGNFGTLQRLVLYYAISVAETFTPNDIVVYFNLDKRYQRRVHDAIQRLVRRGILRKIRRGLYQLDPKIEISTKDLEKLTDLKENKFEKSSLYGKGLLSHGVVRVHSIGVSGVVDLFFQVVFVRGVLSVVEEFLFRRLRSAGFSRRFLSRVEADARRLAVDVMKRGVFILGAHGRYGGGRQKALLPISSAERVGMREVGVDIVLPEDVRLPKMHLKYYTAPSPYKGLGDFQDVVSE
jgi:hypothetical protein